MRHFRYEDELCKYFFGEEPMMCYGYVDTESCQRFLKIKNYSRFLIVMIRFAEQVFENANMALFITNIISRHIIPYPMWYKIKDFVICKGREVHRERLMKEKRIKFSKRINKGGTAKEAQRQLRALGFVA